MACIPKHYSPLSQRNHLLKFSNKSSSRQSLSLAKGPLSKDITFKRKAFQLDKIYKPKGIYNRSIEDIANQRKEFSKLYSGDNCKDFRNNGKEEKINTILPQCLEGKLQCSFLHQKQINVNRDFSSQEKERRQKENQSSKNDRYITESSVNNEKSQHIYDYMAFGLSNSNKSIKKNLKICKFLNIKTVCEGDKCDHKDAKVHYSETENKPNINEAKKVLKNQVNKQNQPSKGHNKKIMSKNDIVDVINREKKKNKVLLNPIKYQNSLELKQKELEIGSSQNAKGWSQDRGKEKDKKTNSKRMRESIKIKMQDKQCQQDKKNQISEIEASQKTNPTSEYPSHLNSRYQITQT